MDEREDSINDAEMVVGMDGWPDKPTQWKIVDYPASYHNGAAGLSFADGQGGHPFHSRLQILAGKSKCHLSLRGAG